MSKVTQICSSPFFIYKAALYVANIVRDKGIQKVFRNFLKIGDKRHSTAIFSFVVATLLGYWSSG